MTNRLWLAALLLGASLSGAAQAASPIPFTAESFQAAQSHDQPLVIEVYAPWCPICARQQPILDTLEASPKYGKLTVLRVDFDSQKAALRDLRVAMQSTLIGFHGKTETGRLIGVVQKAPIDQLFASTLQR